MNQPTDSGQLHRALTLWGAMAFVVTSMVGTGIFTVPAFVRTTTGSGPAALSVWAVGAIAALCGALCYAELATRMPHAGGEYQYLSRVYGARWGFVSGWVSFFVGFAAPTAASALGAVDYGGSLLPQLNVSAPLWGTVTRGTLLAALLPLLFAGWHALGVKPTSHLQSALMLTTIGSILLLLIAGGLSGRGDWRGVTAGTSNFGSWWVALILVSFAYTGWNGATYLAGEIRAPELNLPRALIGGTLIVAALYLALNVLFLYALPANEWQANAAVGKEAALRLFGPAGAQVVTVIITLTIIGSISAWTAAGPRVYYAMAQDGAAPRQFGQLSARGGVPSVALFAQAITAAMLALSGQFETLLTYVGAGLSLFSAFTIIALFVLRQRHTQAPNDSHFRVPLYPLPPLIYLALVGISLWQSLLERPKPTLAALLTILTGFGIYESLRRRQTN